MSVAMNRARQRPIIVVKSPSLSLAEEGSFSTVSQELREEKSVELIQELREKLDALFLSNDIPPSISIHLSRSKSTVLPVGEAWHDRFEFEPRGIPGALQEDNVLHCSNLTQKVRKIALTWREFGICEWSRTLSGASAITWDENGSQHEAMCARMQGVSWGKKTLVPLERQEIQRGLFGLIGHRTRGYISDRDLYNACRAGNTAELILEELKEKAEKLNDKK